MIDISMTDKLMISRAYAENEKKKTIFQMKASDLWDGFRGF